MDTLITIRPIDIENICEIRKDTTRIPGTQRKFQIDNDVANKFRNFDKVRKAVISSEELYSMKPELIISFPKYEEKINLETAIKRLAISNALITEKYGHKDLKVTKDQLDRVLFNEIKKLNNIDNVISLSDQLIEKDKKINELEKEVSELKRKEIVYTTIINEYEDNQQLEDDIKLIA